MTDLEKLALDKRQRTAFYPFGAAEAMLLDRVNPDWQQRYFTEKFFLERFFTRQGADGALNLALQPRRLS